MPYLATLLYTIMTSYSIECVNATSQAYHFGVYQKYPDSMGLTSVVWKERPVPPMGSIPSTASVDWVMSYGASISDFDKNNSTWTGEQVIAAELGKVYDIVSEGGVPMINPTPSGPTNPSQIVIKNSTNTVMNPGFALDYNLIAVKTGTDAGEQAQFSVHPTYYVGCYRDIKLGQLVDSDIALGPVEVKFTEGYTEFQVKAEDIGGTLKLTATPIAS